MDYLFKANAILIIFVLCYKLFLQNETFYQANRLFLLCGLVLAFITPFIIIPVEVEMVTTGRGLDFAAFNNVGIETEAISNTITFLTSLKWMYYIGVLFFLIQFLIEMVSVVKILNTPKKKSEDAFTFIETESNYTAFSFFNYIIYNPKHFEKRELSSIILHEKIHAKQYHTIDVLLAKVISILFWFNPVVWLYKKLLQQNLEFIADDKTATQIKNPSVYQNLLLKTFLSNPQLTVVNTFYNSSIKKRIIMLQKSKSNSVKTLKLAIVLPFLALFLMSFNTEKTQIATKSNHSNHLLNSDADSKINGNINLKTEKVPLYIIDDKEVTEEIAKNLDSELIESINVLNGKQAITKYGDKGKNGVVIITTKAYAGKTKSNVSKKASNILITVINQKQSILVYIDGKESTKEILDNLDPTIIKSIFILKEENAITLYGKKGENGAMIVKTK